MASSDRHNNSGDSPELASGPGLAQTGSLHPSLRVRQPLDDEHRERLLRRVPVPAQHMGVSWRQAAAGLSVAARAELPGLARLAKGRPELARVGHGPSLRLRVLDRLLDLWWRLG